MSDVTFHRPNLNPEIHALSLDRVSLSHFLTHCHCHKYSGKSEVFRPGDSASTMYYVVSGSLSIITEQPDGRELVLGYINAGEFIGEMGLFTPANERQVILRARVPSELAEISYTKLKSLFETDLQKECPKLLYAIGAQISKRLLSTSRKASNLAFIDVTGRIMRTVLDLCDDPEAMTHPLGMQVKVSRQELARLSGCSREMAGRALKELQVAGKLTARGKTVVVFGQR